MIRITLTILALTLLAGCSGSGAATTPTGAPGTGGTAPALPSKITLESVPMILDPSRVPPEPDQPANDATVAGIDSNNNGIRDDVERWIAQTYSTSAKMRAAVAQGARAFQKTLKTHTKTEALEIADTFDRYMYCALAVNTDSIDELRQYRLLRKHVINTPARFAAFDAHDTLLSGQVFYSKKDKSKEANCEINIDSLPN